MTTNGYGYGNEGRQRESGLGFIINGDGSGSGRSMEGGGFAVFDPNNPADGDGWGDGKNGRQGDGESRDA